MHIILGILGAIGGIGFILWRINLGIQAARELGDTAKGVANLPRKMRFQARTRRQGLDNIEDPREAATVLMLAVARAGGEVTAGQKTTMRRPMVEHFQASPADADDLLTHVAWMTRELPSPDTGVARMVRFIQERVTEHEARDLVGMLEVVGNADGHVSEAQRAIIEDVRARTRG